MARKTAQQTVGGEDFDVPGKQIIDTPLSMEVKQSYLEYAYSVIHSRALPDARDGLKPVHRRLLYSMYGMGLKPEKPQVKSARVVGDVLGKLHPHGDSSVYEALVRMAQPFSLNTPLIDGHGNFGSPNDGPAAMRYCVTGDTRVLFPDGSSHAIENLTVMKPESENPIDMRVVDHHGSPVHASMVFHSGTHPVFRLETSQGRTLTGTGNHLVLCLETVSGVPLFQWRTLTEVEEGTLVCLPTVADWSLIPSDAVAGANFLACFLNVVDEGNNVTDGKEFRALSEELHSADAKTKMGFLRALFVDKGDLGVPPSGENWNPHEIVTLYAGDDLARLVQSIATELGVYVEKVEQPAGGVFALRFTETVVPFVKEYVAAEFAGNATVSEVLDKYPHFTYRLWENVLREELKSAGVPAEVVDAADIVAGSGYSYDYVTSVSPAGDAEVYSVRVDSEAHSFLAGGFINHNTECRLAPPAMELVGEIDENTVDLVPNYDNSLMEPSVLPAAFPNLLVNGTSGIAVGMATNMIPHNLREVIAAVRYLLAHPDATLDDVMRFIPGPDLPTGGHVLGADQVKEAYTTGRGTVRLRAETAVEPVPGSRGRNQIIVTELPYQVGTEKVIESIKAEVAKKRLQGVSDVKDLSDRRSGLRLVIECKTGVNPQALLAELYKYTPLETSFGINNLALVAGEPKLLTLVELLTVFLDHRKDVVLRRTRFRLDNAEARLHIVEGLLIALSNVDEVVKTIKASKDSGEAKTRLVKQFILSEVQASHILEMPLRRLVSLEVASLKKEAKELAVTVKGLKKILDDKKTLHALIDEELTQVSEKYGKDRASKLVDGNLKELLEASHPTGPVVIPDEPCQVLLSATGLIARTVAASEEPPAPGRGVRHAVLKTLPAKTTTRGHVIAVTSKGRGFKIDTINLPTVAPGKTLSVRGGVSAQEIVPLEKGETVVGVVPATTDFVGVACGTRSGKVKVCSPDWPTRGEEFPVMSLADGDEIVGVGVVETPEDRVVFVSDDSSLLTYDAKNVRPQGRSGGGMAGMKLSPDARIIHFGVVPASSVENASVVTFTGTTAKRSKLGEYPTKGRGTGGVRSHKFLKGEERLADAAVGVGVLAGKENGAGVDLPTVYGKRDGSGVPQETFDVVGVSSTGVG